MGFAGLTSSESQSTDARVASTDQSVAFGKNSVKLAKGATLNVVTSDPEVVNTAVAALAYASDQFGGNLATLANQQNATINKVLESQKANQSEVLGQIASLADNKLTDGAAGQNQTVTWGLFFFAVVLGIYFWKRH